MAFEFLTSFETGNAHLDDEHRSLVVRVNTISEHEKSGDRAALVVALAAFKADLAEHFAGEEKELARLDYPKHDSHAKHHAETIVALERLIGAVERGDGGDQVAEACYHELISNVILEDMQFLTWLANHPRAKGWRAPGDRHG